jgi:hypothetical protein
VADSSLRDEGSYAINLEGLGPISPGATPLVKGGIVDGAIETGIDAKQFVVDAAAGDKVQLTGTARARTGTFRARFHLWGPGGEDLGYFDAAGGATNVRQIDSLPVTGRYMVEVTDSGIDDAGTFGIGLETISPPSPDALALSDGVTASGAIARPTEIRQYTFDADAGDDLSLVGTALAKAGSFRARFHLWGPGGEDLSYFDAASGQTNTGAWADLPFTGTYVVTVLDTGLSATGTFTLRAGGVRPTPPAISKLLAAPAPSAGAGADVTLTAKGVASTAAKVAFYRESNGTPGLQAGKGGDALVRTDTRASDGWRAAFSTRPLSAGAYTYYARAFDASGRAGNTVSAGHRLTPPAAGGAADRAGVDATDPTAAASSAGLFTVYRKGQARANVSIVLQLTGTATYADDFTLAVTGAKAWAYDPSTRRLTVTLAAGARSAFVRVDAIADKASEAAETVKLTVLAGTGYGPDAGAKAATVKVLDRPAF